MKSDSRKIHILVDATDVRGQMLADLGELPAVHSYHSELVDLPMIDVRLSNKQRHSDELTLPSLRRSKRVRPTTCASCK